LVNENSLLCRSSIILGSIPVSVVVCQLMMYSNVIVSINVSSGSFMFSVLFRTILTQMIILYELLILLGSV